MMENTEQGCAYVNGAFVSLHEAAVPLLDWGFNKSDVVYDGIPFHQRKIFRLADHLKRFEESMEKWRLPPPCSREEMFNISIELVRRSHLNDGIIYLCTTRGVPPSAEIRDPAKFTSRLYGWAQAIPQIASPDHSGLTLIISSVPRIPESSVDATAKNFHWGDLIQARLEAGDRGAQNAILLGHDGYVAEGAGFNVFAVNDGIIKTPDHDCLKGITRRSVLEIAAHLGIDAREANITAKELVAADEVFISSSAGGIFAVSSIDDLTIGSGATGPITELIRNKYWEWRKSAEHTTEVQ